jgi:hypothetical protein
MIAKRVWVASVLGVSFALASACSSSNAPPPPPSIPCDSTQTLVAMQPFAASDLAVSVDAPDAMLDPVRADLARYLGAMWNTNVEISTGAPDFQRRLTLWISTSDAARAAAGASDGAGYAIERVDIGNSTRVIVWAKDAPTLAAGAYALLEELGARFFHPKADFVPALGAPRIPFELHVRRAPWTKVRGLQLHTLHPIEWLAPFNEPSPDNLADAKRLIDWLVKTGQNHVQWALLGTVDFDAWRPHAQAIVDYARSRGVTAGAVVQVWGGAALQNNYVLVKSADNWQAQMDAAIDKLATISWDAVELALGEFVSANPQNVIDWLSHATDHTLQKLPSAVVNVQNHVGNYQQLWVQYQGQTVFYYHLPQYSDPRLGQSVHTLAFYDMYRNWATYGHPDFHLQHDYIVKEVQSRRVRYFPESAYWVTADIDVPSFLPLFIYGRWIDIHNLAAEGLPLEGHVTFSSGHEWGYWLTDYLIAKMLWSPEKPMDWFFSQATAAYGSCALDMAGLLTNVTNLQTEYLFDKRLAGYIAGEDATIEEGYKIGLETHAKRVAFEDVVAMTEGDRGALEANVVSPLEDFAAKLAPIEDAIAARCRGSDKALSPWCDELRDGVAIVRLRASHAALVYRAILAYARGDRSGATTKLGAAKNVTGAAAAVISRREGGYRWDVSRLTDAYDNPTYYKFGYLRQAHTQCFWRRREEEVQWFLDNDLPAPIAQLDTCDL